MRLDEDNGSDPELLDAYRKQLRGPAGPLLTFMAWRGQSGITRDDLIDEMRTVVRERNNE
jgi:hypothetical protein